MSNIDRTLIWFEDENGRIQQLGDYYFGLSTMLSRLLNQFYTGEKIKFININLATEEKYLKFPAVPMNYTHYYGGHLNYYGTFQPLKFNNLNKDEQDRYVWDKVYECLTMAANSVKNIKLLEAVEAAYKKGLELNLNPDYRVVEVDASFLGQQIKASVWINFKEDGMYSKLTLEKEGLVVYEKEIDKTKNGVEFFWTCIKV